MPVSRTVKKVLGSDAKKLEDVVPLMVKILAEGDPIRRIAFALAELGWTKEDVWLEFIKKQGDSNYLTNNLYNFMGELARSAKISNRYEGEIGMLQWMAKPRKTHGKAQR